MRQEGRTHPYRDRISRFMRDSIDSDIPRAMRERIKSFVFAKPLSSACLGLAAGFTLGMRLHRTNRVDR
jgi:hypothetical protein